MTRTAGKPMSRTRIESRLREELIKYLVTSGYLYFCFLAVGTGRSAQRLRHACAVRRGCWQGLVSRFC
jgi:hypothetical protein